jgi:hypothetical protein
MKIRGLLLAGIVFVALSADAQQAPQPLPQPQPLPNATGQQHQAPILHFPITAARYHTYIGGVLSNFQRLVGSHGVTQGDLNKVSLRVKDCASTAEADGWVTANEFQHCSDVLDTAVEEVILTLELNYNH